MNKPTPAQWATNKRSKVCSLEAYERLLEWHYKERYPILLKNNEGRGIPQISNSFYTDTAKREFCSRWLQSIIFCYFSWLLEKSEVSTPFDKGRQIKTKTGKVLWVTSKYSKVGKADLIINIPILGGIGTKILNLEIKAHLDTMSPEQKEERARVMKKGQLYEIVRYLQDFWELLEKLELTEVDGEFYY
jgi:hypothetical protein